MNRNKAFDIAGLALDLAQNLGYNVYLRNPKNLKRRYRWFANKTILEQLEFDYNQFETNMKMAYDLYNQVIEWADEYPLEEENK